MPNSSKPFLEDEMQEKASLYFAGRRFLSTNSSDKYYGKYITPKIYREVKIPQIKRISDIIIYLTDRRIINIECKLTDYNSVLKQAKDHLKWADYSYICLPSNTYLPASIFDEMITNGIGLLFWSPDYFVEVLQSGYNKNKEKSIREEVVRLLKKQNAHSTAQMEINLQKEIF